MNVDARRIARTLTIGVCAILLVFGWYFLAPQQLGGRTAYVTTTGTSMEPALHDGDLVVLRTRGGYEVGDVVAYRSPDLRQVVLHRIVAFEAGRLVTKGDHNTWLDGYRPAERDVLGEMAVRIPGLGARLSGVRSPWGVSALASMAALGVLGGRRRSRRGRERHAAAERLAAPAQVARAENGSRPPRSGASGTIAAVLGGGAAVALAVAVLGFLLPPTTSRDVGVPFEHGGTFSYAGLAPQGMPVYGRTTVETGDPVYLRLTERIGLTFAYRFETPADTSTDGSITLVARLADVNGWAREVVLAPPTAFEGVEVSVQGVLDLDALARMTQQLERTTGVDRGQYTVTITPIVALTGTLAGRVVDETFAPTLTFLLDPLQLQLAPLDTGAPGETPSDPLRPVQGDLLQTRVTQTRTFSVLGVRFGLGPLRVGALAVLVVCLIALLGVLIGRFRSARRGEPALIEARFGRWLVPVSAGRAATERTVDVESFDSLLRLANHYGHVVLHERVGADHAYSVEETGVTYRYLAANGRRP